MCGMDCLTMHATNRTYIYIYNHQMNIIRTIKYRGSHPSGNLCYRTTPLANLYILSCKPTYPTLLPILPHLTLPYATLPYPTYTKDVEREPVSR